MRWMMLSVIFVAPNLFFALRFRATEEGARIGAGRARYSGSTKAVSVGYFSWSRNDNYTRRETLGEMTMHYKWSNANANNQNPKYAKNRPVYLDELKAKLELKKNNISDLTIRALVEDPQENRQLVPHKQLENEIQLKSLGPTDI
ncbi:unnamed protein product [Hymenolepis diminuta]|uniref:Uncharacterized protein n=1 Tax=Hymenolepis diminuta TaxID=6216 RepID=A0A564Z8M2_HYMDI|nr:unnamed protein product [Hymenolepis diminuta]